MTHPYEALFAKTQRKAMAALQSWRPQIREEALAFAWMKAVEGGIPVEYLLPWLVRVAHNYCARILRTERDQLARMIWTSERADSDPAERVLAMLDYEERKAMVVALKDPQRKSLFLQALGYSRREVSEMAGTGTETWINRHLTEGRQALRERTAA